MRSFNPVIYILCCLMVGSQLIGQVPEYAIGADLSFLKAAEDAGVVFKENDKPIPGLELFKSHGYNWIRLRLFHTPTNHRSKLPNDLAYTISLAKEAKKMGMKFLLDYHYSDTWADPGKQFLPQAWEGKSHETLLDSIYEYTKSTMMAFREAEVMPDMVQPGNEVINGMMWPDGKLPDQWKNFAELTQSAINGVNAACGNLPRPKIMIHIDRGGDIHKTKDFYDHILSYGVEFDVIGQSYYPWWHGTLLDLRANLYFMAKTYKKPIMLVEVAYCYTPTEYKERPGPFPETPEGQRAFLDAVNDIVLQTPDHLGLGVFWWEPAVRPNTSINARSFFDKEGNVLPVIEVFDRYTRK